MTNDTKKTLTAPTSDADIVIWPRLKATATKLVHGRFTVVFEVHGCKIRQAEIKDKIERIACF